MRDIPRHEGLRNHADHFAAFGQRSVRHRAHQADRGATVDKAEPRLRDAATERGGGFHITRVVA